MSDVTKPRALWDKWGPWIGPTTIVATLALLTRLDACAYSPASIRGLAESNRTRIEALESVIKAQQATMSEHLKVAEARIQLQDSEKLKLALVEQNQGQVQKDIMQINERMGRIEDKVDGLYGAAMRRGEIKR